MAEPIVVTSLGLKKLEEELEHLVVVRRKEIAENIKQARDYGDLSENSEYDEAKNEQAVVEARITQLETMLKNVKVVDETEIANDVVSVGSTVKMLDLEYDEEMVYQLVGATEANPVEGKISYESPLGKALMGAKTGSEVIVSAPDGDLKYKVLEINK